MRINENIAISIPERLLLVPYDGRHVPQYHEWMSDPAMQEATASEPLTLGEEYENQQSWRESPDKLTFILCKPVAAKDATNLSVDAGDVDSPEKMLGDINFFLYPWDGGDVAGGETGSGGARQSYCIGEIDIMIASRQHRGQGLGRTAVSALLHYIWSDRAALLREYGGAARPELKFLMAKVKATNAQSTALFRSLGFEQQGSIDYFGEVKLVLPVAERLAVPPDGYQVLEYKRPVS